MKIVALPGYTKAVGKLLSTSERDAMEGAIMTAPLKFPVIPATGGFRKARWKRGNRGKSGGVRAIFYYFVSGEEIYLQAIYAKNRKENLTSEECKELQQIAAVIER